MLLIDLRQYVKNHRLVSVSELVNCFCLDANIIRDMLQLLVRKGHVRQKPKSSQCGIKCAKCDPLVTEMYEWIGSA